MNKKDSKSPKNKDSKSPKTKDIKSPKNKELKSPKNKDLILKVDKQSSDEEPEEKQPVKNSLPEPEDLELNLECFSEINTCGEVHTFEELFLVDPLNVRDSKLLAIDKLHEIYFDDWKPNVVQYNSSQNEFLFLGAA